ncbi:MAG: GNAT family N-acetyltransferase [Caldilineaceae bacterium]|nr:GNAT family N-acetyltransferase [Caldilineaceae bacterium]
MSTPDLYLRTGFILNDAGRILSTREPVASRGPLFTLVRSATDAAWAVRADVPSEIANEVERPAQEEPPIIDLRDAPRYADRYMSLVRDHMASRGKDGSRMRQTGGPAFTFPDLVAQPANVVVVDDERLLNHNFRRWRPGEIAAGRSPVLAVVADGYPVSVCFCARRSDAAAEAGLNTAEAYRGRGFAPCVTAAWASAIRASGRVPLYSTAWHNDASLAVARKLGLVMYASYWSLSD